MKNSDAKLRAPLGFGAYPGALKFWIDSAAKPQPAIGAARQKMQKEFQLNHHRSFDETFLLGMCFIPPALVGL